MVTITAVDELWLAADWFTRQYLPAWLDASPDWLAEARRDASRLRALSPVLDEPSAERAQELLSEVSAWLRGETRWVYPALDESWEASMDATHQAGHDAYAGNEWYSGWAENHAAWAVYHSARVLAQSAAQSAAGIAVRDAPELSPRTVLAPVVTRLRASNAPPAVRQVLDAGEPA